MNAFTNIRAKTDALIEAAFTNRGMLPKTFICGCCGDEMDRDDHMRGCGFDEDAVAAEFGPMVCVGCADDFGLAAAEGDYVNEDEAYDLRAEGAA